MINKSKLDVNSLRALLVEFHVNLLSDQLSASILSLKAGKSHETCLTNRTRPISHHIMPLIINALGADIQTHTYQHGNQNNFKKPGTRGLWLHTPGLTSI